MFSLPLFPTNLQQISLFLLSISFMAPLLQLFLLLLLVVMMVIVVVAVGCVHVWHMLYIIHTYKHIHTCTNILVWEILLLTLLAFHSCVFFPLPSTETKVAFILWVPLILFLRQSLMYWGLPTGSQKTTSLWFEVSWIMHVVKQLKLIKINLVSGYRIQVLKPSRETLYPKLYYQPQTIFQRADFEDQIFYFLINLFFVLEI